MSMNQTTAIRIRLFLYLIEDKQIDSQDSPDDLQSAYQSCLTGGEDDMSGYIYILS